MRRVKFIGGRRIKGQETADLIEEYLNEPGVGRLLSIQVDGESSYQYGRVFIVTEDEEVK